jgi:hypothetical protein
LRFIPAADPAIGEHAALPVCIWQRYSLPARDTPSVLDYLQHYPDAPLL